MLYYFMLRFINTLFTRTLKFFLEVFWTDLNNFCLFTDKKRFSYKLTTMYSQPYILVEVSEPLKQR